MSIKILVFDYRESEKNFFGNNKFEHFDITFYNESLNEDFIKNLSAEQLENTYAISVFIDSEVTESVINAFKNLRIISTRSTGVDHINLKAAAAKNIAVINVEGYGSKAVAQFTVGLMIALVRRIIPASQYLKNEERASCSTFLGRDISNLTLGVVGTGAIGAAVCRLGCAFGMKVLAYDLMQKQELTLNYDIKYTDLNTLLKNSDVISLHIPYTGENFHMFSEKQFEIMKDTAYIINTSRGEILDTFALYQALTEKKLAGAALDVVMCEQLSFRCSQFEKQLNNDIVCLQEAKIVKELVKMDNVIVTPHVAYETQDAIDYILEVSFRGILDCIKGGNEYRMY